MPTILHTADVHLDRAFSGLGMVSSIAAARRRELRDAVVRFIDLALDLRVDAITIGGDLYEHDRVTADTGHFLRQQFERLGAVPVLIAAGNHDPCMPGSTYRRVDWPANVTIFGEPRFQPVQVAPALTVWGAGHDGPSLRENLLDGFRVSGAGRHVLLFHGSDVQSVPEGKLTHAPFQPADVVATGADFALLGHYHGARLHPQENPLYGYPGSPEPLDFSESGDHHVLRVDVDDAGVRPQLIPFGTVRYITRVVDVSEMLTSEQIRAAVDALPGDAITRVLLEGWLHPELDLDAPALYDACAERFPYLDIVNRSEAAYDFDQLAEETTTKGAFVRILQERMARADSDEREVIRRALLLGLQAFERKDLRVA